MRNLLLKVHRNDNVLVALTNLSKGALVQYNGVEYTMQDDIPAKHKFFMKDMQAGDSITMYGVLVGKAQHFIPAGSRMTTENTKHAAGNYDYRAAKYNWQAPDVSKFRNRTFMG